MNCHRCNGLMVEERFADMEDLCGIPWMRGWRCMNCGDVLDRRIYQHRRGQNGASDRPARAVAQKRARKSRHGMRVSV
ncbi:MAG TPA: hypothetical protein VGQ60_02685 [Nitrospiraceae bacterium]|nr:hypothetical protein [Nitrospiraceae bacterium]